MALRAKFALALAAASLPASAFAATPTTKVETTKKSADPAEAFAFMNRLFDKLFPAGPEPDPARLAAARQMTMVMLPKGAYAEAMYSFAEGAADNALGMSEADFLELVPPTPTKGKAAKPTKVPSREPLRLALTRKDPMFDAKLAAGKAFVKTMLVKVGDVAEPRFREGMARSMARRFDAQQMTEIQRFLATPTGAAYGRQMLGLWFDPEVMRGFYASMPDLVKLMPSVMQDAAALEGTFKAKKADEAKPTPKN